MTRHQRHAQDKLAPIRKVFEEFISHCRNDYCLSKYVTVDKMLEGFCGRCSFRQYILNKPAWYGIKIFTVCEVRTFYTSSLEVYMACQPTGPYKLSNSANDVVLHLTSAISGTGCHVTLDNWYGSVPLAKNFLHNHRLTMVSTLP